MHITDVRVRKVSKEGKMKAVVSITIDDEFVVHDIKVIEGEKGLFIAMPSRKASDGEYRDIAHRSIPVHGITSSPSFWISMKQRCWNRKKRLKLTGERTTFSYRYWGQGAVRGGRRSFFCKNNTLRSLNQLFTEMISKQEEKRSIITRQNERGTLRNEDYTKEYYQVIW